MTSDRNEPLIISQGDVELRIAAIWQQAVAERRPPNVAVAEALGIKPNAVAQRVFRMRARGWVLPDGNDAKSSHRRCPTCGAPPSKQTRDWMAPDA